MEFLTLLIIINLKAINPRDIDDSVLEVLNRNLTIQNDCLRACDLTRALSITVAWMYSRISKSNRSSLPRLVFLRKVVFGLRPSWYLFQRKGKDRKIKK